MKALVIHPRFTVYGGGEFLCLQTCSVLQKMGYDVDLVSDERNIDTVRKIYGNEMGDVIANTYWIPIPAFRPIHKKFMAFQRLWYANRIANAFRHDGYDISFSTQSSIYRLQATPSYHFLYDIADLFKYPLVSTSGLNPNRWYYFALRWEQTILFHGNHAKHFFALGEKVLDDLHLQGYENSSLIFPPCRMDFHPKEKIKRVVQATRLVPQKRLEFFFRIAERLPQYDFLIVGRDNPILQRFNPGYADTLMKKAPENVIYTESPIKERPDLLEESKVYLYTGIEPGIGIAMCEAMGAGCIPVAPSVGGGSEVIRNGHAGYTFPMNNLDMAASAVEDALESTPEGYDDPLRISRMAKETFGPQAFEDRMRGIINGHI